MLEWTFNGILKRSIQQRTSIHQYPTRNIDDLVIPKFRTSTGQRTFHFRAAKLWNSQPRTQGTRLWNSWDDSIKSIDNIKTFKIELNKYLFTCYKEVYIKTRSLGIYHGRNTRFICLKAHNENNYSSGNTCL